MAQRLSYHQNGPCSVTDVETDSHASYHQNGPCSATDIETDSHASYHENRHCSDTDVEMQWLGGSIVYDQNGPRSTTDVKTECHVPQWSEASQPTIRIDCAVSQTSKRSVTCSTGGAVARRLHSLATIRMDPGVSQTSKCSRSEASYPQNGPCSITDVETERHVPFGWCSGWGLSLIHI